MNPPLAFMLTFRTYGTWLHGDSRGSVDDEHNVYRTPLVPPDTQRQRREAESMRSATVTFNPAARRLVESAIRGACEYYGWELIALAVRSNHVHAVVGFHDMPPERMAQRFKARATRLMREHGLIPTDRPVWAAGPGSRKYLWTEQDVADAALYVEEYQDEPAH